MTALNHASRFLGAALLACALLAVSVGHGSAAAADPKTDAKEDPKASAITLADGKISLTAPKSWQKKKPRTRIVEYEFAAPKVEGDPLDGRVTVMGAGGGIEANINRWIGQFSQPDRKPTRSRAKIEKLVIAGQAVHLVDLNGTFKDQRGPFAPAVMRKDYRMLGAIIVTEKLGHYFIKLYGPKKTVAANEKAFKKMLETLEVK